MMAETPEGVAKAEAQGRVMAKAYYKRQFTEAIWTGVDALQIVADSLRGLAPDEPLWEHWKRQEMHLRDILKEKGIERPEGA